MSKIHVNVKGEILLKIPVTVEMTINSDGTANLQKAVHRFAAGRITAPGADLEDAVVVELPSQDDLMEDLNIALEAGKLNVKEFSVEDSR